MDPKHVDDDKRPRIEADGSHVFPIRHLYDSKNARIEFLSGEVRWSPTAGVTFRFVFSGWGNAPIGSDALERGELGGTGKISALRRQLDWTAELHNSGRITALDTNPQVSCTSNRTLVASETSTTVSGSIAFLYCNLPIDNEFAFEQLDRHTSRLFATGFNCHRWPEMISVERMLGFGASSSMGRGEVVLSAKNECSVFSAEATHMLKDCVFLSTNEAFPGLDAAVASESGDEFQDFFSFVSGAPTRGFWREWSDVNPKHIHRLYLGWKTEKTIQDREGISQPLPLSGTTEAFEHCPAVTDRLPSLFENWQKLPDGLRISHYMTPIWLAFDGFWEDRLVLACVAIERFANSMRNSGLMDGGKPAPVVRPDKWSAVRKRLSMTLRELKSSTELADDEFDFLNRKIDNANQPPNSDNLVWCFEALGLELTQTERKAISHRNRMLHGSKAFNGSPTNDDHNAFAEQFDVLRTLLHKASLAMLGYNGPYVDYGSREDNGNFPVAWMSQSQAL